MKQSMINLAHVKSTPIAEGEISVVISDDAEDMMRHAADVAITTQKAGAGVMLVNCGMSVRRFNEHMAPFKPKRDMYYHDPDCRKPGAKLVVFDSVIGDLVSDLGIVESMVMNARLRVVIIMGWEWTSNSSRRKERLLFALRDMVTKFNVAVLIYSQVTTEPEAGKADKGGLGRLSQIAVSIIKQSTIAQHEAVIPAKPLEVIVPDLPAEESVVAEVAALSESAQLVDKEINELQDEIAVPAAASSSELSEWSISPEGTLITGEEAEEVCI